MRRSLAHSRLDQRLLRAPVAGHGRAGARTMSTAAAPSSGGDTGDAGAEGLLHLLADAHAHPQLDPQHIDRVAGLRVPCVAAMGVAAGVDWGDVERLVALAGEPARALATASCTRAA
jgi:hypothetical protein